MKVVFNTRVDDATSRVAHALQERLQEAGVHAMRDDWDHYDRYDIAVFLPYDHEIDEARRQNPAIRVVLFDPKQSRAEWIDAARRADLLVVSSVEQRDAFYRLNRNILVHLMFPVLPVTPKVHREKEPIVIGYHGNRVHLECMFGGVQLALNELARRRPIEFWALYNVESHGRAEIGLPDEQLLRVRHLQWTPDYHELAGADIGIMPTMVPLRDRAGALERTAFPEPRFVYEPFDHLLRFKASANAGRLYPFAQLGIPVVADFTPSAAQLIEDGRSGLLASSPYGWLEALETLSDSTVLRSELAAGLKQRVDDAVASQAEEFVAACTRPLKPAPSAIPGAPTADEELAQLHRVRPPSSRWRRVAARLLRP